MVCLRFGHCGRDARARIAKHTLRLKYSHRIVIPAKAGIQNVGGAERGRPARKPFPIKGNGIRRPRFHWYDAVGIHA